MTDESPPRPDDRVDYLAHHADQRPDAPAPLTAGQRAALVHSFAGGNAPQKACADAGVDPLHFIAALTDDAELAVQLGQLETVRSLNVLAVTYQKALSGASADRSLYLKFRPPPPPVDPDGGTARLDVDLDELDDPALEEALR